MLVCAQCAHMRNLTATCQLRRVAQVVARTQKASTSQSAQASLAPLCDNPRGSCSIQGGRYNVKWIEGGKWLKYSKTEGAMFCTVCREHDRSERRNQ